MPTTTDHQRAVAETDHPNRLGRRQAATPGRRRAAAVVAVAAVTIVGAAVAAGLGPARSAAPTGPPSVRPEVPVTATDLRSKPSNNSPQLAVDPTDHRFVALANRLDAPFGCALHLSGNGGRGWVSVDPVPELPAGAETCYGPEVAFDRDGKLYYLFVGLSGAGNSPMGVFLTWSSDRGQTFSPPRLVLGPERYQVRMAIDRAMGERGRIHLVWLQAGSDPPLGGLPSTANPIMAARSDDGGMTFTDPVQVSDAARQRVVAPAVAVGADGELHVLYYDLQDDARDYQGLEGPAWEGTWSLLATSSAGGGTTFGPGIVVDDGIVPPGRVMLIFTMPPPALAVDRSGRVFAGWHDARNGDWDVFVRASEDGGRTWAASRRLNDDPVGNGLHQHLPQLSVGRDGRLDAIFYDRRSNQENRGNQVFYTYSTDGGRRFAPNVTLTAVDFDSAIGPRYLVPSARGLFEFGGRIALASDGSTVLAAWTDTRNTGRGFPAQDIFATEVAVADRSPSSSGWRLAGAALAVVGLGILGYAWARARHGPVPAEVT